MVPGQNSHLPPPHSWSLCTRWLLLWSEALLSSCGHKQLGSDFGIQSFWFGQQNRLMPHSREELHGTHTAFVVVVVVGGGGCLVPGQNSHLPPPHSWSLCTRWLLLWSEALLSSCGHRQSECEIGIHSFWFGQQKRSLPHSALESHASQTPFVVVVVVVVGSVAMARCISLWKFSVLVFMLKRQKYSQTPNSFRNITTSRCAIDHLANNGSPVSSFVAGNAPLQKFEVPSAKLL